MSLTTREGAALAAGGLALAGLLAAGWLALQPMADGAPPDAETGLLLGSPGALASASEASSQIVVDVQGAVAVPGVVVLPGGSRVADAIAEAGGYSAAADLAAAAATLNLAAMLHDGEKVFVPLAGAPQPAGGGSDEGGLVNVNTASPEALEALPGIGPVTVQKIVAAREERAFGSLDELVERKVLNRGQLDDIRDLVTV
ncbi:MAG TPA: helix-hairpin-helix domain-containing protein [Candidatus Limnocylindria bacterium]